MTRLESGGLPYSSTRLAFQAASSSRRHRLVPRAAKALISVGYRAQQRPMVAATGETSFSNPRKELFAGELFLRT
jgi:hypothetical protein